MSERDKNLLLDEAGDMLVSDKAIHQVDNDFLKAIVSRLRS
jgi:mannitol/fructose-specific phosphotransferase system IIA component (Ntr-type)